MKRLAERLTSTVLGKLDDERIGTIHDELHDAARDPAQRRVFQRPVALEDRRARDRPIDA
jgi:hypothetical protein